MNNGVGLKPSLRAVYNLGMEELDFLPLRLEARSKACNLLGIRSGLVLQDPQLVVQGLLALLRLLE
jgi:hypothetical protein